MKQFKIAFTVMFALFLIGSLGTHAQSAGYGKISIQELRASLGNPDLIIIDVRDPISWSNSRQKISGAFRENPDDVASWAKKYPRDKTIVLY